MKIVCGSCQAKYSIADEKVAGKVFRIRCKRCGEVIVVRGDQDSPEANVTVAANGNGQDAAAAPAAAAEAPSDAIWHVVINGEQAGPYSPAQLGELVASGQLDWEAYVWSEGFENWQPMRDVPDLVSAISGGQAVPVSMGRPAQTVANTQMGADPFPEEAPAQQVAVFAKAAGGGSGGGVVHTNSRADSPPTALSSFDSGGPGMSNPQGPRVSAQQAAMTGSRNENSVLFSLKNLQALATGSVPPPASHSVRPGHAAGEGSGLIDIRALATTTGVAETNRHSEKDALLALGSAQGGAFGGLGSPMLAAPGKAEEESGKKPLVMAIVGGCALLAIAVVAVAFIMRGGSSTPAEVAPVAPAAAPMPNAPAAQTPQPSAAAPSTQQPTEALSEGELAARAAAAKAAEAAKLAEETNRPSATHNPAAPKHASSSPSEKAPEPAAAAPTPAAKPAEPTKPKSPGSIDSLLDDAIGGKTNSIGSKPAADANLQEKPSRDDVLKAMKGVTDAVKACGQGQAGVAFANLTVIGKTGRVGNVEITGISGEPGSCIARAVRKASFPKFSAENFQVKFPFRL